MGVWVVSEGCSRGDWGFFVLVFSCNFQKRLFCTAGTFTGDEKTALSAVVKKTTTICNPFDKDNTEATAVRAALKNWNFYMMTKGMVDDTANTRENWVETAYVIHHIQGLESENLDHFEKAGAPIETPQVGFSLWKNVDLNHAENLGTNQWAPVPDYQPELEVDCTDSLTAEQILDSVLFFCEIPCSSIKWVD